MSCFIARSKPLSTREIEDAIQKAESWLEKNPPRSLKAVAARALMHRLMPASANPSETLSALSGRLGDVLDPADLDADPEEIDWKSYFVIAWSMPKAAPVSSIQAKLRQRARAAAATLATGGEPIRSNFFYWGQRAGFLDRGAAPGAVPVTILPRLVHDLDALKFLTELGECTVAIWEPEAEPELRRLRVRHDYRKRLLYLDPRLTHGDLVAEALYVELFLRPYRKRWSARLARALLTARAADGSISLGRPTSPAETQHATSSAVLALTHYHARRT